jgi:hypothetical protein
VLGEALRARCTEQAASLSVSLMRVNQSFIAFAQGQDHAKLAMNFNDYSKGMRATEMGSAVVLTEQQSKAAHVGLGSKPEVTAEQ